MFQVRGVEDQNKGAQGLEQHRKVEKSFKMAINMI